MYLVMISRYGRVVLVICEDEIVSGVFGINIIYYKIFVFVLLVIFVGIVGGIYVYNLGILGVK